MALERIQMAAQDKEINQEEEEQPQAKQLQVVVVQVVPQVAESVEEKDKDITVAPEKRE